MESEKLTAEAKAPDLYWDGTEIQVVNKAWGTLPNAWIRLTGNAEPCHVCGKQPEWRKSVGEQRFGVGCGRTPLCSLEGVELEGTSISDLMCVWADRNVELAKAKRAKVEEVQAQMDLEKTGERGAAAMAALKDLSTEGGRAERDDGLCRVSVMGFLHDQGMGFGYCLGGAIKLIVDAADKDARPQREDLLQSIVLISTWIAELDKEIKEDEANEE